MSHLIRRRLLLLLLIACLGLAAVLPLLGTGADDDANKGRRYALLVGVKNYDKDQLHSLQYTENDVNDLAAVFKDAGYKRVVLMTQSAAAAQGDNTLLPTAKNVRKQLAAIMDDRKPDDSVLIAFSGHGVQFSGQKESYFCPMDADLEDVKSLVSLAEVYKALEGSAAGTKVLLADACRNDPQAEPSKDVAKVKLESRTRPQSERAPGGVAAFFSCSEGQRSYESEKLQHGVFFHYVIAGLKGEAANKKGEVTLQGLTAYVTDEVPDAVKDVSTEARQRPQQVGDLSGAMALVKDLLKAEIANTVGMKLKLIHPGKFLMGSPKDEEGRSDNEGPQHQVEITRPYYMGVAPVTKGQFAAFVKEADYKTKAEADGGGTGYDAPSRRVLMDRSYTWRNTGWEQTDAHPVVNVAWTDAQAFCVWLSKKEGKTYELPTEAEWEYACRAGTTTRFWSGDADESLKGNANILDASLKEKLLGIGLAASWDDGYQFTSPVGKFRDNPWGLDDMNGNVRQWCADAYGRYHEESAIDPKGPEGGDERVMRGGSWLDAPRWCRSAVRERGALDGKSLSSGFRVVLRPASKVR